MKVLLSALSFSLFSLGAFSATITLYEVAAPTPTAPPFVSAGASFTISPVGVGENGKTTYAEEEVLTEIVDIFSDSTTTLTPPPTTFTYTVEEDASGLLRQISIANPVASSLPGQQIIESCNFQGTTAGSCVNVFRVPGLTTTTAYSGTLIPVYTLTETARIPGQTQNSGALTRNKFWGTRQLMGLLFGVWITLLAA